MFGSVCRLTVLCDCWGKHQSCSHRSGDGEVRPHIWVRWRMWVQNSTAYASMSALLSSLSALSMWLQQLMLQTKLLLFVGVCVYECVHVLVRTFEYIHWATCKFYFIHWPRGETLYKCGGEMWNFSSCCACRLSNCSFFKSDEGRGVSSNAI